MPATGSSPVPAARSGSAIVIIGVLFFIFGFVTWLNGPLITFVKLAFDLDDVNAFLVPMVFYLSYFFLALPASWILDRTGMKKGMALGTVRDGRRRGRVRRVRTQRWYPGALTGLFVIGAGLALLQTASNPYISILGPIESAAQRIAFMGICNKIAGILAPLVIGALVLHGMGDLADTGRRPPIRRDDAAHCSTNSPRSIHVPYLVMAGVLALLGSLDRCVRRCRKCAPTRRQRRSSGDARDAAASSLSAPVARRAVPVRLRRRRSDGRRCDRHLRAGLRPAAGPDQVLHLVHAGGDAGRLRRRLR